MSSYNSILTDLNAKDYVNDSTNRSMIDQNVPILADIDRHTLSDKCTICTYMSIMYNKKTES